ncbi:MAG: rod shape-determining protein MreD [Thermomicrobiaceae bacterium]
MKGVRFNQGDTATVTRLLFAILLILIAIAQSTIFSLIDVVGIAPNIVLVLVLVLSGRYGVREGLFWAFGAGIMLDILALDPLGSNALALIPVAVIGSMAQRPMLQSGLLLTMLMVLLATLAHFSMASIIDTLSGTGYSIAVSIRLGLVTAFLNTLVVPPLYGLVILLDRFGVQGVGQA